MKTPLVLCGPSGCGKTTLGKHLAQNWQLEFVDADSFHSQANKAKMAAGIALSTEDRTPWLAALKTHLTQLYYQQNTAFILACSALTKNYRDNLRKALPLNFIALETSQEILRLRLQSRKNHFMPADLLTSQLATWQPLQETEGITLNANLPLDQLQIAIQDWLQRS